MLIKDRVAGPGVRFLIVLAGAGALLIVTGVSSVRVLRASTKPVVIQRGSFVVAGTRIVCQVTVNSSLICSTRPDDNPTSNSYSLFLTRNATLVFLEYGVSGRSVLYSRGPLELPGKVRSGPKVTVRAHTVVQIARTGLGCSVGATSIVCASHLTGSTPTRGSYGFVVHGDGSASTFFAGPTRRTLFAAKAQQAGTHNTFSLNLGDSVGVVGTRLVCAAFRIAGVPAMLCEVNDPSSNRPVDKSYVPAAYSDGRVEVARVVGGNETTVFKGRGAGGPNGAVPGASQANYSAAVGDHIALAGTSVGCLVGSFRSSGADHDFVSCAPAAKTGSPAAGTLLATLEQDGIAVVSRLDSSRTPHVVYAGTP